ncbi:dimethylarginine dimethylaminohydrolase family protein [Enterococcus cecorum]|uniref:Nitrate reductase n=1 Tax=Enterococcus cecorum TaxID=44008 RepID=A0A366SJE4_9ENTE|nr:dimethylarginine dimethylaminohydrolase family protein [Enterococcus cecorum]MCJ0579078.1 dimethylarginine dimethylaminohydrolase family protein [Enterococcus cecorum]MCJ0585897.1 dimethylarginine dimethylaminohydrolase family protein [Enterococcus cecorum]MCJ0595472.1 dimethylarginine dimethylaminohydrolase family protein [Enterococcus cecorum]MCJ0606178.1 dimethylarginine dimethylaminohydrolase family protein [Enterococcus cecorum]MDZ5586951.1 dimethylarginine dimethylaminohydrolase famil
MSENIYVSNATNVLKEVIVCSPKFYVFNAINEITKSWMEKGETEQNERMVAEWQTLVNAYRENGVIVHEVDAHKELEVQTFARDFGAMVKEGAIIGKFRHPARQKETEVYEQKLKELGIPVIARVNAGCFEGGDFWMIDDHTLAFGLVDRTDQAGVDNLREQLAKYGYTVVGVPVPPANLHLDMVFNIVAEKVCIAATEQLPYNFIQMLKRRNYKIIDVPSELVFKHGCNVQALGNGKVLGIENNKSVNEAMEAEGIEVIKLPLEQILKAGGGPHCMTFPVRRA